MEASTELKKSIGNEAFWQHHHELLKSSGMKRSEYCHKNDLNYDQFGYWISRWNRLKKNGDPIELVSVKLKSNEPAQSKILCTLDLKNGGCLKIHHSEALAMILERYC
jgi:hypothetical protein